MAESEFPPFLNGSDLPSTGVLCEIQKVRQKKNSKEDYFFDVKADDGEIYTVSANNVLTHMILQELQGSAVTFYPYKKGDKTYVSTRKPADSNSSKPAAEKKAGYGSKKG